MRSTSYVCFDCRRAVKAPAFGESDWRRPTDHPPPAPPPRCPGCAAVMHDLGKRFKAPRKADRKQWEKVRRLFEAGFAFHGYARTPQTLAEVDAFLAAQRARAAAGGSAEAKLSKPQTKRRRKSKVAQALTGPTFGPAARLAPPVPGPTQAEFDRQQARRIRRAAVEPQFGAGRTRRGSSSRKRA